MAEGGVPEAESQNHTNHAQHLIYGAGNLEYQLQQFVESGEKTVKIVLSGKTGVGTMISPHKRSYWRRTCSGRRGRGL